jgi:uncharacterized protein (DUF1697 family)
MARYVALLRAVNVGGTGKLPMSELTAMCVACGFTGVRTYIASGNVVFDTRKSADAAKAAIEAKLAAYAGKPVPVFIRTAAQMAAVLAANPFPDAAPNRTIAVFLDAPPPRHALAKISGRNGEDLALGEREIYILYTDGMADSKLKVPAATAGTGRNMNTVAKLAAMADEG